MFTIPAGVVSLEFDTCGSSTNFPTYLWFLNACPNQQLNNPNVVQVSRGGLTCGATSALTAMVLSPSRLRS